MDAKIDVKKAGHIKLVERSGARAVLEVGLPPGTSFKAAAHVVARVDEVIHRLTGCPCNSGLDIIFRDGVVIPLEVNEHVALGG